MFLDYVVKMNLPQPSGMFCVLIEFTEDLSGICFTIKWFSSVHYTRFVLHVECLEWST